MTRRFAKVSEEETEEPYFYPSDFVNTKTTITLRVGEEQWIYTSTLRVSGYIHHYSPPLRGIVVYNCSIFGNGYEKAFASLANVRYHNIVFYRDFRFSLIFSVVND